MHNISIKNNYFVLAILGIIICLMLFNPTIIIFILFSTILIIFLIITGIAIVSKPHRFLILLIIYVVFQNLIAIILAKNLGGSTSQAFILGKDLLVYIGLVVAYVINFKKYKITLPDLFAFLYLIILSIYLLVPSDAPIFAKLVQYRQLSTPVILFLLGRLMFISKERTITILKFLVYISVISVLFGYLERFILGDQFWITIGITDFLVSKGMESWAYGVGGLPGNFYTFDYYAILGTSFRRLVSFVADPTLYGQFLVFPIGILLFTKLFTGKKRNVFAVILLIGLVLTLSKGGIFALGIAIIFKIFRSKYRPIGYLALFFFTIITFFIINNASLFSSLPHHINGLFHNIELTIANPFGLGLGEAGNFAKLYSDGSSEVIGAGESYIGMLLGQIGIFSVPFLLFFLTLINFFRRSHVKTPYMRELFVLFAALNIGVLCSSMISESAISFISSGILYLMSGVVITNKTIQKEN
ncbi:polymerase [Bacillus sp. FJAT-50079]|uniref:polymerase n=1 Tax=Bacillus sp. FJAT-50079 TaxID=2833577 RepID=UPI001BC98B4E|nr:polymerase [Bacillus sp. FJAT-50079]MBS4206708.1 polymerase [Bacillus sp. FJAT-50079]